MSKRRRCRPNDNPRILNVLADTCRILGVVVVVLINWFHISGR